MSDKKVDRYEVRNFDACYGIRRKSRKVDGDREKIFYNLEDIATELNRLQVELDDEIHRANNLEAIIQMGEEVGKIEEKDREKKLQELKNAAKAVFGDGFDMSRSRKIRLHFGQMFVEAFEAYKSTIDEEAFFEKFLKLEDKDGN